MMISLKKIIHKVYIDKPLPAVASFWFAISAMVQKGIIIITTPFFTRIMTQEEYGLISVYNSWMSLFSLVSTFALTTGVISKAMIKYKNRRYQYISSILFLISCFIISFYIMVIVLYEIIDDMIGLDISLITVMFVDIFFTAALSLWTSKNQFDYNYPPIVTVTIISNLIGTLLSLLLVCFFPRDRVMARIMGTVIVHVVLYSPIYVYVMWKGKVMINKEYWRYSIYYNMPLIPHYLSQQLLNQSDRIMIGNMCGNRVAAIYSLSYQVAIAIRIIIDSIFASFNPWIFQQLEYDNTRNIGKRAIQIEIWIGAICCGFSLFAPEMVFVMGGKKYSEAAYLIPPISMSVLFITLYSFFSSIEFYYEKTKMVMVASCFVAILNLFLNMIFIDLYGYSAAAYTTLACYIIYAIVHYLFMINICKKEGIKSPFQGKKIWGIAIIYSLFSLTIIYLYRYLLMRYIGIAIIVAVCIIGCFCVKKREKE